jgi:GntR family transcriptional repressor for pyruvate dehydrogenase complex
MNWDEMSERFSSVTVTRHYEQIVRQIQEGIRQDRLVRGQKLPTERELAEQFGVSRAVVREAVKVLDAMGLVETRQGSGIFVRNDPVPTVSRAFTLIASAEGESVNQLFEFRRALECAIAGWAALRRTDEQARDLFLLAGATQHGAGDPDLFASADDRFHSTLAASARNPYVAVTLSAIRGMQTEIVSLVSKVAGSLAEAAGHHLRIADAVIARDAQRAVESMAAHIDYTAESVAQALSSGEAKLTGKGVR